MSKSEKDLEIYIPFKGQKIIKIKWWLSDGSIYPDLCWARLRVFSNGKTDILFENENKLYGFENEEFASNFLLEDEFTTLENLDAEYREFLEIPKELEIEIPKWENKKAKHFEYIGKY